MHGYHLLASAIAIIRLFLGISPCRLRPHYDILGGRRFLELRIFPVGPHSSCGYIDASSFALANFGPAAWVGWRLAEKNARASLADYRYDWIEVRAACALVLFA